MSEYGNLGPYELEGELGRGAMARVWRARDTNLLREVAIKEPLFDSRLSQDVLDEMGRRFVAEGRAAAGLDHPGIVTIYAADVFDGRPAIVMELVQGTTLSQVLSHGPLAPTTALPLLEQLLDAVGYAHAHAIVHRDIKPDNIFVTPDGRVKLADFGIAHLAGSSATMGTVAGQVLGSPGYMSPEQATGAPVDARSDLFSVGIVAYEMLAGHNPFGAVADSDVTTMLYRIVHEPVPELPAKASEGLPADLRPAIMAALAKDPNKRPQSAAEFSAMLRGEVRAPTPVVPNRHQTYATPPEYATANPASPTAQRWLPYALVAAVSVLALAGVLLFALNGSSYSRPYDGGAEGGTTYGSPYSVGLYNGRLAIYTNSSSEPFEISKVRAKYLSDSSITDLEDGISAMDYNEARQILAQYRTEARNEKARRAEQNKGQTPPLFTTVSASSYLPWDSSDPDYHYEPEKAFDHNTQTAWNEGATGPGIGEWIQTSAGSNQYVQGVRIVNGFSKVTSRYDLYTYNNRPSRLRVEFSDGTSETITLIDRGYEYQSFTFSQGHTTTYVKLVIEDIYWGSEAKFNDACISEIEFF